MLIGKAESMQKLQASKRIYQCCRAELRMASTSYMLGMEKK
jgi:hypothetical protein